MDRQVTGTAVRKRAWFYYALAQLAVARNLAVALAIAAMCVGVVGLTLWAVGVKQRADAAAARELSAFQLVDPNMPAGFIIHVPFVYRCGHAGSFAAHGGVYGAKDPAGMKAELEQMLCPGCQAQADFRAQQAEQQRAVQEGTADATH